MDLQSNVATRRRAYMMLRLQRAMRRLALAQNRRDELDAMLWVNAWSSAVGNLHFGVAGLAARRANTLYGGVGQRT